MVECERCDDTVEEQYVPPRADNRIICASCIAEQEELDNRQVVIMKDYLNELPVEVSNYIKEVRIP